jgi:serine/threonine protein kinase
MPIAERADVALSGAALESVVAAVASFADTLMRLHALDHHHRDIKPANLYRLNDQWLVGDFGIVDVPDAEAITRAGKKFGPANFLPYELITNPDTAAGGPVDVYELAKTLWVLAAGESFAPLGPQPADGGRFTLDRITGGHPLAAELDGLVEACTRTDANLRPPMAQVAADLRAWLEISNRREQHEDKDALRDATAELRSAFADDLTAGQLHERRVANARIRITSLGYGVEQLANELRTGLPGAVNVTGHNETAMATLRRSRVEQIPDPVTTGMHAVVVRPKQGGWHPELVLAVVAELEADGRLRISAGVFLDFPGVDVVESERIFESDALVESIETENAVEESVSSLRAAAPTWLRKLKENSA